MTTRAGLAWAAGAVVLVVGVGVGAVQPTSSAPTESPHDVLPATSPAEPSPERPSPEEPSPAAPARSAPEAPSPPYSRVGRLEPGALNEASGLVASQKHPGVFWTHNDSGGAPVLFAVGADGRELGRVEVTGARNRDWEAIASDGERLYIGDIGNNRNRRKDLAVIVVPEPDPADTTVAVERTVGFRYPDQTEYPPAALNFDAEAMVHHAGDLYILTKHRGDRRTVLHRMPRAPLTGEPRKTVLTKLRDVDVGGAAHPYGGMVTAADVHPDGRLAVLSYHALFVWPADAWLEGEPWVLPLGPDAAQCEALAWDGDDLIFTNEGRGVFRVTSPGR